MGLNLFQRHSTDEQLLAYADGELPARAEEAVRKHLKSCWQCRGRLREMESSVSEAVKRYADPDFLGPVRIAEAQARLETWRRGWERSASHAPLPSLAPRPARSSRLAATVTALAASVLLAAWLGLRQPEVNAAEILASALATERQFAETALPVEQTLRLEVFHEGRAAPEGAVNLVIAAEGEARYAARLRAADGTLMHAVWRTAPQSEYVYNPAISSKAIPYSPPPKRSYTLTDLASAGIDPEEVESVLIRWLENRDWRPVFVVAEFARFAGQDGVTLTAERIETDDGRPGIRLMAAGNGAAMTAGLVMEAAAGGYRPRLQELRLRAADGAALGLRLTVERLNIVPAARLSAAVYEPEVPLAAPFSAEAGRPVSEPLPAPRSFEAIRPPSLGALTAAEVEVRYVLHRMRACLGEPVEVLIRDGGITVRGVVDTDRRQGEIVAALAGLDDGIPSLRVEIGSAQSVARQSGEADPYLPGEAALHSTGLSQVAVRFLLDLEKSLRSDENFLEGEDAPGERVTRVANKTVARSGSALDEIWAIRRFAERYTDDDVRQLDVRSRWLLEMMLRDHLTQLRADLDALFADVVPPFARLVRPESSFETASFRLGANWRDTSAETFAAVRRLDRVIKALFADSAQLEALYAGQGELPLPEREALEQAAREVLATTPALSAAATKFERQALAEFSSRGMTASERSPAR